MTPATLRKIHREGLDELPQQIPEIRDKRKDRKKFRAILAAVMAFQNILSETFCCAKTDSVF